MLRIHKKVLHAEISYELTGILFKLHRTLGRFCRERQYCDKLEELLKENRFEYKREYEISKLKNSIQGDKTDFLIENKIILDIKAKKFITKEDYLQMQRYLQCSELELGLIVNFRNTYLKPKRILNTKLYSDNSDAHSDYSDRFNR
ncbi:MAG: hypothetical protein A2Y98_01360 [Candidatus Portnoybacteria bacterium RBG_19FT_COMBO_36_7]|uniref:GxxExxY protein n=1 Tax=Candidatus Portnoybacteria bacterium RBG_19FT_COMBO_36_7 TaxID=1801992 RepID=A0A1G2F660_9BACT|nr:MAG: hypothetical protein A2Y98_01360 [Candidatus Portnoybacteria bacterium RBG_19FT_COMBO_36_7]